MGCSQSKFTNDLTKPLKTLNTNIEKQNECYKFKDCDWMIPPFG